MPSAARVKWFSGAFSGLFPDCLVRSPEAHFRPRSALMKCLMRLATLLATCLAGPLWAATAASAPVRSPVEQVIIVFKTHFDIGYTDLASNVVQRYRTTMIEQALKVVDQNRDLPPEQQFVWTLPGWPMAQITANWSGQTAERKQRVLRAFQTGRFAVHALPFSTHTELLEPEDLVRGLGFASRLSRAAGLPLPRDAKMTDVPCHSWILPTLLRHAGVDLLHLGCNAASSSPRVPVLFWWEGPDGSRLLTMYSADGYGTGLVPPADWPYRTWLALIHTGDNHGPPTPEEVARLLAEAKTKLPGVRVRIGRLSDFADALLAAKPEIPVVRGDMPDTWIHGPMSDPQGARLARNLRPVLGSTESLQTMLGAWGLPAPDLGETLAHAYEQSLLYGEHTWGGAQYWVTKYGSGTKWGYGDAWRADERAGRFQRLEDSWAEHSSYIETAQRLIEPALRSRLQTLAEAVTQPLIEAGARGGERLVVFNPLPWERSQDVGLADLQGTAIGVEPPADVLAPPVSVGNTPPVTLRDGRTVRFGGVHVSVLRDGKLHRFGLESMAVPPMGYRAFWPLHQVRPIPSSVPPTNTAPPSIVPAGLEIRAGGQVAILDPARGVLRSLTGLPIGAASPYGFGQVLYERFDSNNVAAYVKSYVKIQADWAINELGKPAMPAAQLMPYRAASPTNFTVRYSDSGLAGEATFEAAASEQVPFGVTTRFIFYKEQPFFDLEVTLRNKPADPWPEAAWICLPFQMDAPQFRLGRQGSIVDPAKDIVSGANHNLYALDSGVALFETGSAPGGRGVGLCPLDSPLISLDKPGCWQYDRDFIPRKPVVFINLFNNQWTTNFRLWNKGTWTSRVRIWRFDRYDPWAGLVRPSLEARYPLQALCVKGPAGNLPVVGTGLTVARRTGQPGDALEKRPWETRHGGALVTAFGPNPDGAGTLLRLWELAGNSEPCRVQLPVGLKVKSVQPVDLRGRSTGPAQPVSNSTFETPLRAFGPASFLLQ